MNKCKINLLLVIALLLFMPCLVFALPGAHDPSSGLGYTCNTCHVSTATFGNTEAKYASNICLQCHATGDNGKTKKLFKPEDIANPLATVVLGSLPNAGAGAATLQTSHKWFGNEVVTSAGAQKPADNSPSGLNKTVILGSLSCAKCHNVHGNAGPQSTVAPYLRYANDEDQLCRACHVVRDTTDHTKGSHPINVSYTSASAKAKKLTGDLLQNPLPNATNPTGQVKLVNSKIVCSTCHGVHNTDSNSATFDAYTTGHVDNITLTPSKGHLTRVNLYGATANATNICTNCHANKFAHNKAGQNVQCNDCHSGHVEYDKDYPLVTPNTNLVRRYLQYTTNGRISKRIVSNTSTTNANMYNASGGVCQSCHNLSASHYTGVTLTRTDCANCHKHNESTGSFTPGAGACDTCHGYPPVSGVTTANAIPYGGIAYTGNEATSPHARHSGGTANYTLICAQCHNGFDTVVPSRHQSGLYNDGVFVTKVPVGTNAIVAGPNATYTTGTKTCSSIYCHSDGTSTASVGTAVWSGNLGCGSCHAAAPITNSHSAHATRGYGCKTCHFGTLSNDSTINVANNLHVNAVKDVQFSGTLPAVGATCSVVACHGNGKGAAPYQVPVWGSPLTGDCGSCHLTGTSTPVLATGAHTAHINVIAGSDPAVECATCHTYTLVNAATHVDGNFTSQIKNASCATTSCHGSITSPVWTAATTADSCTKCHGTGTVTVSVANRQVVAPSLPLGTDTGNVSSNLKTGAHQTHILMSNGVSAMGTKDVRCENCHGSLTGKSISHADGSAVPAFQGLAKAKLGTFTTSYDTATATCSVYCHNPAGTNGTLNATNVGTGATPVWNNADYIADAPLKTVNNCGTCHKNPWDAGFTSSYTHGTMTTTNLCDGCHGHNGDTTGIVGQQHMDGIKYGNGACDTCHGYPPVTAAELLTLGTLSATNYIDAKVDTFNGGNAGGGGHHTTHLLKTINQADAWGPCLPCHPSHSHNTLNNGVVARANVNVNDDPTDMTFRLDSNRTKRYNTATLSCSNISCHYKPTSAW